MLLDKIGLMIRWLLGKLADLLLEVLASSMEWVARQINRLQWW